MASNGKTSSVDVISNAFRDARQAYIDDANRRVSNLYDAAKQTRFTRHSLQLTNGGSGEDYHYSSEADYFRIIEIARDLDRNDMVVGQGISRGVNNVIQTGFALDPKTGNPGADVLIKDLWDAYATDARSVDFEREKTFHDLERLLLRSVIVDGDIIVLPIAEGSLQVVEAHRLRTPRRITGDQQNMTVHGVRLDGARRRVKYYICRDDQPLNAYPSLTEVDERDPFDAAGNRILHHLYYPKRMTQTRGVSRLAPVTDAAAMHADIQFAKLVQQQSVSVWAFLRKRQMGFELPPGTRETGWRDEADPCREGQTRPIRNISAGMMYTTYPGEDVQGFSPNVPNPTFFDHARQVMEIIAINLDLPLILFLLDASETNFSGWRGAFDQSKVAFRVFQKWFSNVFHRQVFNWKMRQWSTAGTTETNQLLVRLRERGVNVFAHEWVLPAWPYIEPLKESTADLIDLKTGTTSPRRVQGKRSRDWDDISSEIVDDWGLLAVKAIEKCQQIKKQFPDEEAPPKWRELAPMPLAEGHQMAIDEFALSQAAEPEPTGGRSSVTQKG